MPYVLYVNLMHARYPSLLAPCVCKSEGAHLLGNEDIVPTEREAIIVGNCLSLYVLLFFLLYWSTSRRLSRLQPSQKHFSVPSIW